MASFLRRPFGTLTTLRPPPRPGSVGFAAWRQLTKLNNVAYRATGGRIGGSFDGNPVVLLHHVGRRSGEPRVTPLIYLRDGDDLIVVGSMGGTPKDPAWIHNLRARPEIEVELGKERRHVHARIAAAGERARLWPMLIERHPAFADYQARCEREIPVVILAPRG